MKGSATTILVTTGAGISTVLLLATLSTMLLPMFSSFSVSTTRAIANNFHKITTPSSRGAASSSLFLPVERQRVLLPPPPLGSSISTTLGCSKRSFSKLYFSIHAYSQDIESHNSTTITKTTDKTIHRLDLARQRIIDRFEAEHKENSAAATPKPSRIHRKKSPQHSNPTNNITTIASIPFHIVDASLDAKRDALIHTLDWLEHVVIGYNLCPFAETPLLKSEIAVVVVLGSNTTQILATCLQECLRLQKTPGTSLVVCPDLCPHDFLGFLEIYNILVEGILPDHDLQDDLQIAPFHPKFVFGDNEEEEGGEENNGDDDDDITNYTNRSPHPIFHILREVEVEKAVDKLDGDAEKVWKRNVDLLEAMEDLFSQQTNDDDDTANKQFLLRSIFLKGKPAQDRFSSSSSRNNASTIPMVHDNTTDCPVTKYLQPDTRDKIQEYREQIKDLLRAFRKKNY